jgi:hypothetical protein
MDTKINDDKSDESYIGCVVMPVLGWIVFTTQILSFFLPLVAAIILGIAIGFFLFGLTPWSEGHQWYNPIEMGAQVAILIILTAILLPVFRQAKEKARHIHQRQIYKKYQQHHSHMIATKRF